MTHIEVGRNMIQLLLLFIYFELGPGAIEIATGCTHVTDFIKKYFNVDDNTEIISDFVVGLGSRTTHLLSLSTTEMVSVDSVRLEETDASELSTAVMITLTACETRAVSTL